MALADGYILTGNRKALTAYRSAWLAANPASPPIEDGALVAEAEALDDPQPKSSSVPTTNLTDPVLLWPDAYQPIYFSAVVGPDSTASDTEYAVDLRFRISTEGRARRIKVVNENVPNREVRWTRTMVLNSRFRPALRNGIPEEVDFSLRQVFIPRPDKAAAIDANRSTTDASETDLGPTPEAPPVGEPSRIPSNS
jgi:hypothetical protein